MIDENSLIESLKTALVEAGLNPAEAHDMRLFTNELSEPGTTIAEAAQRAGQRKARTAQGSGFDQLNEYMQVLRRSSETPATSLPSDHSQLSGFDTLQMAIAELRQKGSLK